MASSLIDTVSQHVQATYSTDGVEIVGRGPRSLNVQFPLEFHDIGAFCADMETTFNARMDMNASIIPAVGPTIVIYPPHEPGAQQNPESRDTLTFNVSDNDSDEDIVQSRVTTKKVHSSDNTNKGTPAKPPPTKGPNNGPCASLLIPLAISILTSVVVFGARSLISHIEL